jgi:hypothetical protein
VAIHRSNEYIARLGDSGVFRQEVFQRSASAGALEHDRRALGESGPHDSWFRAAFNDGSAQRSGGRRQLDIELADNDDYASRNMVYVSAGSSRPAAIAATSERIRSALFSSRSRCFRSRTADAVHATHRRSDVKYPQYQFGWYVQDDFRVRKNLTLSYGVRHEFQNHVPGKFNIAPRFGWVWSP